MDIDAEYVEIIDPQNNSTFYVNPLTGECQIEKPSNIRPKDPSGEWWELYDEANDLPYYYHTITKKTEWTRPKEATVIPLFKLQELLKKTKQKALENQQNIKAEEAREAIDSVPQLRDNKKDVSSIRSLPDDLKKDINRFRFDGFAIKYFGIQKRGIFRKKVPLKELIVWTSDSITGPLLELKRDFHKDSVKSFKQVQRIMGDRSPPANWKANDGVIFLLGLGVNYGEFRDEIYVQIVKQLTNNPSKESIYKGWELICILCTVFPPSKNFEEYLLTFVQENSETTEDERIETMTKYIYRKLLKICESGPRGKVPVVAEIERARVAPFRPSVFGESLIEIMKMQAKDYPDLQIPRVLPFLAEGILALDGRRVEGLFRVPGDHDAITELRLRIENGKYDLTGIRDANCPAGLLKLWLRELADPLIPSTVYDSCIQASEDPERALMIVEQLPEINKNVVKYVIKFLQIIAEPENIQYTKMNVNNIAMVFAPNFLRCPSNLPSIIFENTKYEQSFVRNLVLNLK